LVVLWFYAPNFSDTYYVDLYDCCWCPVVSFTCNSRATAWILLYLR
jgi:hypothetical protein